MRIWMTIIALLLSRSVCAGEAMTLDFSFAAANKCQGRSPELRLRHVPYGTRIYAVTLTDLEVPAFRHWQQKLPAKGNRIAEGVGSGYFGPCPPSGEHRYQIVVQALDGSGKVLASASRTVRSGR